VAPRAGSCVEPRVEPRGGPRVGSRVGPRGGPREGPYKEPHKELRMTMKKMEYTVGMRQITFVNIGRFISRELDSEIYKHLGAGRMVVGNSVMGAIFARSGPWSNHHERTDNNRNP